jgi:Zn-dependent protease with chaperone function
MQPICSAEQEIIAERSMMSQTKDAAYKVMQWGKKSVNALVSPKGQYGLIALYVAPYLYEVLKYNRASTCSVATSELPIVIQKAIRDMNPQQYINFKVTEDFICYAQRNIIVLTKELFSFSDAIQRYITGHEMAHIELHHTTFRGVPITIALIAAVWFSMAGLEAICMKYEKHKDGQTYTGKALIATQKIVDCITNNPVILFGIMMTIASKWEQYIEREADLEAINRLKCAQGAVEWAYYRIEEANKRAQNSSWWSYISPLALSNSISNALGWTGHDPRPKALEYLLPLAQQQAATII